MTGVPKRPGPRQVLSEAEILDAALALLDAGGPDAASIRRIAAAVGCAPNAVYTYFPDKAAVTRALVDRLLGEVDTAAAGARGGWRERLEALALEIRTRLTAHPGAVPLLLATPMEGPHALVLGERVLDLLAEAGLSGDEAARGAYLLIVYVLGAIALEAADVPHAGALPPEPERIAARRAAFAGIAPDAFPRSAAAAGVMGAWVGTGQFLWGLRRTLAGLTGPA